MKGKKEVIKAVISHEDFVICFTSKLIKFINLRISIPRGIFKKYIYWEGTLYKNMTKGYRGDNESTSMRSE